MCVYFLLSKTVLIYGVCLGRVEVGKSTVENSRQVMKMEGKKRGEGAESARDRVQG